MQVSSIIPFPEFRIFQDGFVGITLNVNWNQPITSSGMVNIILTICDLNGILAHSDRNSLTSF